MDIVNTRIMKHPLNWVTIWSMVLLMAYVGHLLISFFNGRHPGDSAAGTAATTENVAGPGTDIPNYS